MRTGMVCLYMALGPLTSMAEVRADADIVDDLQRGQRLQSEGHLLEAEQRFDFALEKAGTKSIDLDIEISALSNLASVEMDLAHLDIAAKLYQRALRVLSERNRTDSATAEELRLQLAELYLESGQVEMVEPLVDRVTRRQRSQQSPVSANDALALDIRACLYAHRKKLAKAEQMEREALAILETIQPPADAEFAIAMLHLGSFLNIQKRPKDALPYIQRSLEMLQNLRVRQSAMEGIADITLASIYSQFGQADEARRAAEDALRVVESYYGAAHPNTGTMLLAEAAVLRKIGAKAAANQFQDRGDKILTAARNSGIAATVPVQALLPK